MNNRQRRQPKQIIDLEQLKRDSNSFLSLHPDDPVLRKLETIRLRQAGFTTTDITKGFGFARQYLYEIWHSFESEGTIALINKHWGSASRKTTKVEAAIIRAKTLHPEWSDKELADEFGLDRKTIYCLLKEHGIQDLHRVKGSATDTKPYPTPNTKKSVRKRKPQSDE